MHRYLEVRFDVPAGQALLHRISALAAPVLVVSLSGRVYYGTGDAATEAVPPVCFTGPLVTSLANRYEGAMHGFMVRFAPWGLYTLLKTWGPGLPNAALQPDDLATRVLRQQIADWAARLHEAPDFAARAALTNAFLLDRLGEGNALPSAVPAALHAIEQTSGTVPMARLARQVGVAESTLRRQLVETTGVAPKLHAQITRFRHAWAFLQADSRRTWADAVTRFGYTDQSHFIHEHRRFSGEPPTLLDASARYLDRSMGLGEDRPAA